MKKLRNKRNEKLSFFVVVVFCFHMFLNIHETAAEAEGYLCILIHIKLELRVISFLLKNENFVYVSL